MGRLLEKLKLRVKIKFMVKGSVSAAFKQISQRYSWTSEETREDQHCEFKDDEDLDVRMETNVEEEAVRLGRSETGILKAGLSVEGPSQEQWRDQLCHVCYWSTGWISLFYTWIMISD